LEYIAYVPPELSVIGNTRIQTLERDQQSQYFSPILSTFSVGQGENQLLGIQNKETVEIQRKKLFIRHVF